MGKSYKRNDPDWWSMAQRSAARRQARKLAELAWGVQQLPTTRQSISSPVPAESMDWT